VKRGQVSSRSPVLSNPRRRTWRRGDERHGGGGARLSVGALRGKGRRAEGVGPSHREQGNGQLGKGFGAKTITYRTACEAAEERERDQDAGSKPGRGRDADRRSMGGERHRV